MGALEGKVAVVTGGSIERNIQVVKDFFVAIGRRDKEGLLAVSAEDIEWIIPGED